MSGIILYVSGVLTLEDASVAANTILEIAGSKTDRMHRHMPKRNGIDIIFGARYDDSLKGQCKVIIIAAEY